MLSRLMASASDMLRAKFCRTLTFRTCSSPASVPKKTTSLAAAAHLRLLQDRRQRRARPPGVADGGGEPGEAMIAGAFEGEDDLAPGPGLDVVERQPERARDGPADLKRPGLLVDHRAVVMRDAEEPLIRRQPGVQVLPLLQVLDVTGRRRPEPAAAGRPKGRPPRPGGPGTPGPGRSGGRSVRRRPHCRRRESRGEEW